MNLFFSGVGAGSPRQGFYGNNSTSSLEDPVFQLFRKENLTIQQKTQFKREDFRINASKPFIEDHLNKRVLLFALQAFVSYRIGHPMVVGPTSHQGLKASSIEIDNLKQKLNAAHSATIPSLYIVKEGQAPTVYLPFSQYYKEMNSTMGLLEEVNRVDSLIDGNSRKMGLRNRTISLLNRVSKGEVTPDQAVLHFTDFLIEEIESKSKENSNRSLEGIFNIYLDTAFELHKSVQVPENIDLMLNLQMESSFLQEASKILLALKNKEEVSREQLGSLIKEKIKELSVIILEERHRLENEAGVPVHFSLLCDYYFLFACKKLSEDPADFEILEEAMGIKFSQLKARVETSQKTGKTKALLEKNSKIIDGLAREVLKSASKERLEEIDIESIERLSAERTECLRPSVYELRGRMVLNDQETQSEINTKIAETFKAIKQIGGRATHLESFYYARLLSKATNEKIKLNLCKLLNISSVQLREELSGKEHLKGYRVVLQKDREISEVYHFAVEQMERLNQETREFQADLFKELRISHGMKQERFSDIYQILHRDQSMSVSSVSRLENGEKEMTPQIIEGISNVFKVNPSLFYPSHFAA